MTSPHVIFRGERVVTPSGVFAAAVHVRAGVITEVAGYDAVPARVPVIDAGKRVLFPGLVDTHVHLNEPGRAEWEGFRTGTRAAAAGGVTTLVDMPLNSVPPTTSVAGLQAKLEAARGQCWVDVGFWGGVVPGNADELRALSGAGVLGFKCFLVDSGVPEFPAVTEAHLRAALPIVAALGAPLLVHAELPGPIEEATTALAGTRARYPRHYLGYLRSRPQEAEVEAVELLVRLCQETRARIHVVHLSAATAVAVLSAARRERLPMSAETCPHYLYFAAEEIGAGATLFKCAPPIRSARNREELWRALEQGELDMVVSDHSPCPPELKCTDTGDYWAAWGGISSLGLSLVVMWHEAQRRGHGLERLAEWLCAAPARLAGMAGRKGAIAPGHDADLVIWDPDAPGVVEPGLLEYRHKHTPYAGARLHGAVEATYLRGRKIYERGELTTEPDGRLLLRHER